MSGFVHGSLTPEKVLKPSYSNVLQLRGKNGTGARKSRAGERGRMIIKNENFLGKKSFSDSDDDISQETLLVSSRADVNPLNPNRANVLALRIEEEAKLREVQMVEKAEFKEREKILLQKAIGEMAYALDPLKRGQQTRGTKGDLQKRYAERHSQVGSQLLYWSHQDLEIQDLIFQFDRLYKDILRAKSYVGLLQAGVSDLHKIAVAPIDRQLASGMEDIARSYNRGCADSAAAAGRN